MRRSLFCELVFRDSICRDMKWKKKFLTALTEQCHFARRRSWSSSNFACCLNAWRVRRISRDSVAGFLTVTGNADGCNIDELLLTSQDRLGLEAIKQLHRQLDDDADGNVDLSESDEVSEMGSGSSPEIRGESVNAKLHEHVTRSRAHRRI